MTPKECCNLIMEKRRGIDRLHQEIDDIAKDHILDFHFLDYRVSIFWSCVLSPIGMCVFCIDRNGLLTKCRYCGDPVERK